MRDFSWSNDRWWDSLDISTLEGEWPARNADRNMFTIPMTLGLDLLS